MGRHAMMTSEEYNRRRARQIVLQNLRDSLRPALRYALIFAFGACVGGSAVWVAAPEKYVLQPIYVRHAAPAEPAVNRLTYQCTKQEIAEHIEACKGRKRMESVK